jgi:amidase
VSDEELAFAGPSRLAGLVRDGEVTPRELVEGCLARIARLDPELHAFRAVLPEEALAEADRALAGLRAGEARPLLGVPFAVKDDQPVAGQRVTRGTGAVDTVAPADGELVGRLRAAGAVVVGITNVPELTLWGFTETLSNGATRNPWDRTRTPGGSSGGSAAAVAAGLVPLATASDGAGSVRIPAALCSLFGLKLTRGRVGWGDREEVWNGMAVPGLLTRSVADAALAHEAVLGEALGTEPGPRLRIAVTTATPPGMPARLLHAEHRDAVHAMASLLGELGHEVHEHDLPLTAAMAARVAVRYLAGAAQEVREVDHPELLERRTRKMVTAGRVAARGLARARAWEATDAAAVGSIFAGHDLVLMPTVAGPPPPVGTWSGRGAARTWQGNVQRYPFTALWNHLGNPAASVPAGFDAAGLPLSVQLAARPGAEAMLLSVAAEIEEARPWAQHRPSS